MTADSFFSHQIHANFYDATMLFDCQQRYCHEQWRRLKDLLSIPGLFKNQCVEIEYTCPKIHEDFRSMEKPTNRKLALFNAIGGEMPT